MYAHASGNAVLARLIEQVRARSRLFELVTPFDRIEEDRAEHLAILNAYNDGDAVRTHLRNLREFFVMRRISEGAAG